MNLHPDPQLEQNLKPTRNLCALFSITRAGALAGVGLALDPEGKKSVLIQPSSFEKNTLNVTFLDFLAAEVQLIMIFRFSLGYVLVFGNRQISSLEKYINRS